MKIPYLFLCYFPMGYVNNYHQERKNVIRGTPRGFKVCNRIGIISFSPKKLSKIVSDLSNRYRTRKEPRGQSFIRSKEDVYAYAAFRMPATFAAVYSALKQMKEGLEDWAPHSLLDVGAGPGTVMWAANEIYPSLNTITLLKEKRE